MLFQKTRAGIFSAAETRRPAYWCDWRGKLCGHQTAEQFAFHREERCISMLLNPHADHLLGLPMRPQLSGPDFQMDIYSACRNDLDVGIQEFAADSFSEC